VLNAPWYFTMFYKMMSPFVEQETKDKFKILSGDPKEQLQELLKVIDADQIEEVFGGKQKCKFVFKDYYAEETKQVHVWYAHEEKLLTAAIGSMADDDDDDDDDAAAAAAAAANTNNNNVNNGDNDTGDNNAKPSSSSGRRRVKKKRSKQ